MEWAHEGTLARCAARSTALSSGCLPQFEIKMLNKSWTMLVALLRFCAWRRPEGVELFCVCVPKTKYTNARWWRICCVLWKYTVKSKLFVLHTLFMCMQSIAHFLKFFDVLFQQLAVNANLMRCSPNKNSEFLTNGLGVATWNLKLTRAKSFGMFCAAYEWPFCRRNGSNLQLSTPGRDSIKRRRVVSRKVDWTR